MNCRLCLQSNPLCDSHLFPEFLYQELYDAKHRFLACGDLSKGKVRLSQKGYREKLLCRDCEARINVFETHSHRFFSAPLPPPSPHDPRVREFPHIDYSRLKLFLLSVLWRASVSSHPFFTGTRLTDGEKEDIRSSIIAGNAGDLTFFPTILFNLHYDGAHFRDFMTNITISENPKCHRLVLGGFIAVVYSALPDFAQSLVLRPGQSVRSFDSEFDSWKFLSSARDTFVQSHFWQEPNQVGIAPTEQTQTT